MSLNCLKFFRLLTPSFLFSTSIRNTTILHIRKGNDLVMIGDGQVSAGSTVVKPNARKIRRLGSDSSVIAGIAGATADALALIDRLEVQLEKYPGQLMRAAVEMAKEWRTDKYLRHLEAQMVVCDCQVSLQIHGNGDVLETAEICGIGSGGLFAYSAAKALFPHNFNAEEIAIEGLKIAADIDVYTNHEYNLEKIQL